MEIEEIDSNNIHEAKKSKKTKQNVVDNAEKDNKEFLDEIEEDPEMRDKIMLFKVILYVFTLYRMKKLLTS